MIEKVNSYHNYLRKISNPIYLWQYGSCIAIMIFFIVKEWSRGPVFNENSTSAL
jgi:hypothetical protein